MLELVCILLVDFLHGRQEVGWVGQVSMVLPIYCNDSKFVDVVSISLKYELILLHLYDDLFKKKT